MNEQNRDDVLLDKIRGSLLGGAMGDALGYPVEFLTESEIKHRFGDAGITEYALARNGKALISDDTQMTLFTANGLLYGETRMSLRGIGGPPSIYIASCYKDWLCTQQMSFEHFQKERENMEIISWLCDVPELFSRRAPGNTCLSALMQEEPGYIDQPINNSKGCGGIMRVAPIALFYGGDPIDFDMDAAKVAAITHGHPLGYTSAAVLNHIISRIVYPQSPAQTLKEIVLEAINIVCRLFEGDKYLGELRDIVTLAVELSENAASDIENIHRLGEGWVAEETLAIAIYCSLKYQNDFSRALIAAVNHKGDSDSTGAVTGNIVGAIVGLDAIPEKWKKNLELYDVIDEMACDLYKGCPLDEYGSVRDDDWEKKYVWRRWGEKRICK